MAEVVAEEVAVVLTAREQKMIDETDNDWMLYVMDINMRCNVVTHSTTVTPAHIANKAGQQPGGEKSWRTAGILCVFLA